MRKIVGIVLMVILVAGLLVYLVISEARGRSSSSISVTHTSIQQGVTATPSPSETPSSPLSIAGMRAKSYPGSTFVTVQTLPGGSNYTQSVVSYLSDGLKIYGLLAVPTGSKPAGGWPGILLNHGYVPPAEYSTSQSYSQAVSYLAHQGYVVFKPDYRGNGMSEGQPRQVYISPDYVTDTMNALASLKQDSDVNPAKIGVWGHSMGGNITLHDLVLTKGIKVAVIWGGVVGSYGDILQWWERRVAAGILAGNDLDTEKLIRQFQHEHGTPESNPVFWNSIDPTYYLADMQTPVFIQVGTNDTVVPPQFSESLSSKLKQLGKTVSLQEYAGADHNLVPDSAAAIQASVAFFDKYLK